MMDILFGLSLECRNLSRVRRIFYPSTAFYFKWQHYLRAKLPHFYCNTMIAERLCHSRLDDALLIVRGGRGLLLDVRIALR
jgi:hypothetical protein